MQGHRCSDGYALRFSYRGLPPVSTSVEGTRTPIPSIVFETEGAAIVPFDAYENTTPGSHFFPGYMLFTSAGDWLIETRDGATTRSSEPPSCGSAAPRSEPRGSHLTPYQLRKLRRATWTSYFPGGAPGPMRLVKTAALTTTRRLAPMRSLCGWLLGWLSARGLRVDVQIELGAKSAYPTQNFGADA